MAGPVEPPTVDEFVKRFPEFNTADEYMVSAMLEEAAAQVDDSWRAADIKPAIMYLAAHKIAGGAEQEAGGSISSVSIGAISISYRNPYYMSQNSGELSRTEYGLQYLNLLRKNRRGPLVV